MYGYTPDSVSNKKMENKKLNDTLQNLINIAKKNQASKKIVCLIFDDGIGCINWNTTI